MEEKKQRDYIFDTLRGLCMWSIPISHFTRMAGHFTHDSFSGVIYITINVFVMQAFMFLSGYFSKNVDKSRTVSFKTFLWPYILSIFFFYGIRLWLWGKATLYFDRPPFAMWFMLALFLYKFFQKDYIKIPHFFTITFLLYLFAGCIPVLTEDYSLGRIVSYFPFFFLGYYFDSEHIKKIKCLKTWEKFILGLFLIASSYYLAYGLTDIPVEWYLLRRPGAEINVSWYTDIIMRLVLAVLGFLWIIWMFNILPNKNNYLAYVGRNTMPVYIFHLVIRQWIKKHTITMGLFTLPAKGSFAYYALVLGLASLCVIVFSCKPVVKIYNFVVDGLYKALMKIIAFLQKYLLIPVEKVLIKSGNSLTDWIEKQKG